MVYRLIAVNTTRMQTIALQIDVLVVLPGTVTTVSGAADVKPHLGGMQK
jgi:hypothetical protein